MRYRELCIASLLGVAGLPALAQDVAGTWAGTFTMARVPPASVEIVFPDDSVPPVLRTRDGSETPLTDVRRDGSQLLFKWGELACSLKETREGRDGTCRGEGVNGRLTITRPTDVRSVQHSSDVVTADELATTHSPTLEMALRKLRGLWFQGRKELTTQATPLAVFIGGQWRGGTEALQDVPLERVKEVRYFSTQDATVRYGIRYRGGVILVTEKQP